MDTKFRNIDFPRTFKYSSDSDHIPLEFYEKVFPIAKKIDLLLGYFSSNAFKVLSYSFAEFIFNGGEIRIVTNHILSNKDKSNLIENTSIDNEDKIVDVFGDLEQLARELGDYGFHFFDCLKYLLKTKRLQILPVKFNGVDLAHCKKMILYDGQDFISTDGSINFTLSALTKNSESFEVNAPWMGEIFNQRTILEKENFEKIFSKSHPNYEYLNVDQIEGIIFSLGRDKNIQDLLDDSVTLASNHFDEKVNEILERKKERFDLIIEEIQNTPKFPFDEPREYQKEAYLNWVNNDYQGLFAMATGTGKTITSLNCIVNEYNISNTYNFIVLVPTISLANQWENEVVHKFNFNNTTVCSSKSDWEPIVQQYGKNFLYGSEDSFCIITTYATYRGKKFQRIINHYFKKHLDKITLIADEAHTFGAPKLLEVLPQGISRRIALSATPERMYDNVGQQKLMEYFNSFPPNYTYSYNMKKAIDDGILCRYYYFPKFVDLVEEELSEYKRLTKQLYKYIDSKTGRYKDLPEVSNLLIRRKSIIHKAKNKKDCLVEIVDDIGPDKFKYAFVYVPEGIEVDYSEYDENRISEESNRIIDSYSELLHLKYGLRLRKFLGETNDRDNILDQFEAGKLDALLAMKCLDEGVDVPRAEYAIFCSSTGNPRQYIQRRGRILRSHPEKDFAHIYDMIVKPPVDITITDEKAQNAERGIFEGELRRLINFAALSENKLEILDQINEVASIYDIDVYKMLNTELEKY